MKMMSPIGCTEMMRTRCKEFQKTNDIHPNVKLFENPQLSTIVDLHIPEESLKKRLVHRFFNGAKLSKVFISSFFGHSIVDSGTEPFYGIKQPLPIQHNNDHSRIQ